MSLHRTLADWPIVAAAWLITLLAAVLLSAGPIYSSAVAVAGLQRTLLDASVVDANVEVSTYGLPAEVSAEGDTVRAELEHVIEPIGGSVVRSLRTAQTLSLEGTAGEPGDLTFLGAMDDLAGHATLTAGSWPADTTNRDAALPVVALGVVAEQLHLSVGDEFTLLARRLDQTTEIAVQLVGTYAVNSPDDAYWFEDDQLLTGIEVNPSYRTLGPFLATPAALLAHAGVDSLHVQWRLFPDYERLTVDGATALRARLAVMPDRIASLTGTTPEVKSGLPAMLSAAERSLLVSRAGVLLLIAQLGILAAYSIILTASLLVDHRRIDTALLGSRGAGSGHVALLALAEGLLLAVPAVALGPWLAVAALTLLNTAGPLAAAGLAITPRVTTDGYAAAAAAGLVCIGLLVLPAIGSARRFAVEQGGLSRQETRTFGQRVGVDVALVAITAIALWQLRTYGAPLTRTVQGSLGLDPLLVAAPAIGLLAGGVVALRILPLLAQAAEGAVSRGRHLVGSLGSRQLARRPLRYTRSALLLMLALSMGVFALAYAATWTGSQRDQARYQTGADLRVAPGGSASALSAIALPDAYAALPGVSRAVPVERDSDAVTLLAGSSDLLALNAATAASVVHLRRDESPSSLGGLMGALRAGRPAPDLVAVPAGTGYLRIVPRVHLGPIVQWTWDEETGREHRLKLDPATVDGIRIAASVVVRDGQGLLHRITSQPVAVAGSAPDLVIPLDGTASGSLKVAAVGVDIWLPPEANTTTGSLGILSISAGATAEGAWTRLPLGSVGSWRATLGWGNQLPQDVPGSEVRRVALRLDRRGPLGPLFGNGGSLPTARLTFLPASLASAAADLPVLANRAFLDATGSVAGDAIGATVAGAFRHLTIAGTVESFPTTDPQRPLLVFDEPTLGLLRLATTGEIRDADEWWIGAERGQVEALAATLRDAPFSSAEVTSTVDRRRSLSADPVALGFIGALVLGSAATGLFAIVGLTVSAAVSARQRRTEFALLRALGLSGRQLSRWLWLENGSVVLISILCGVGLGILISWLVLPFVTVTQQATTPVPPVIVKMPWLRILLLNGASALALGVSVIAIGGVLRRLGLGSILRMGED